MSQSFTPVPITTVAAAVARELAITGPVVSVNGRAGFVTIDAVDVSDALGFEPVNPPDTPFLDTLDLGANLLVTSETVARQMPIGLLAGNFVTRDDLGLNVATLDPTTHVLAASQIPPGLTTGVHPKGNWDCPGNNPHLSNGGGGGVNGDIYFVNPAGTTTIDGISSWSIGDCIFNQGGTLWVKTKLITPAGTMSVQNSNSVAVTGGAVTGLGTLGLGTSYVETPVSALVPGYVWLATDSSGNAAGGYTVSGVLTWGKTNFAEAQVDSLTATTADIGGAISGTANPLTGMQVLWLNDDGEAFLAFDGDCNLIVSGMIIDGQRVTGGSSGGSSHSDALNVTDYGAIGDAVSTYCYVTTSGAALTIAGFTGTLSLSQLTGSTALLTIVGAFGSGLGFQPNYVGEQLYLTAGAYSLQAEVATYIDGQNIVLNASGVTAKTLVSGAVTCPCFVSGNASMTLVVDGMGQNALWPNIPSGPQVADSTTPFGQQTFFSVIGAVVSPTQITLASGNFPFNWTSIPAHVRWGTDSGNAIAQAARAAFAQSTRKLYFPGDGASYLAMSLMSGSSARMSYGSTIATDAGALMNGVIWEGDNTEVFACDPTGLQVLRRCAPAGSETSKWIRRSIHGAGSLRRCSHLSTINCLIVGDSQATPNPEKQAAGWMQIAIFKAEFRRANPGKNVVFWDCAIGGSTFDQLANPLFRANDSSGFTGNWSVPRPINGTVPWQAFLTNINQTSSGGPILPDCVYVGINAGNDSNNFSAPALQYVINLIRSVNHGDGFGPADILLQTDQLTIINVSTSGNGGGVPHPDALSNPWWNQYGAGLLRSTADTMGFGIVDLAPLVFRACSGYDPVVRDMRAVPVQTVTATPTAPLFVGARCTNWSTRFTLTGASDAAAWASMSSLSFQTSLNRGGKAQFRLGPNGHIWAGVSAWGGWSAATCTIASAGTSLTLAAPTVLTGQTYTQRAGWPQLHVASAPFNSGMAGLPIIVQTGAQSSGPTYAAQRNWIRGYYDASNVMLNDDQFAGADINGQTGGTITIGPAWLPEDSFTCPDVVIIFGDGTIWNTQVAYGGYVSATQVTLAGSAPQALTNQTVQMFIGRMMPKWFDTGFNVSAQTGTQGEFEVEINDSSLMLSYLNNQGGYNADTPIFNVAMERFGAPFFPTITPGASQQIVVTTMYVDVAKPFSAVVTPWELRGIGDINADFASGGAGGHPSSLLATNVTGPFYSTNNLCTY